MKMEKRKMRIGDLADQLGVERFVIRFWEKEFGIRARRSSGGQRFYTQKDAHRFAQIKELLYNKKFTIAGAKKFLNGEVDGVLPEAHIIASQITSMEPALVTTDEDIVSEETAHVAHAQLLALQKKLYELRDLLNIV